MIFLLLLALLCVSITLPRIQALALNRAHLISFRDGIYTPNQTSNTVTTLLPLTNEVFGTIFLDSQRPSSSFSQPNLQIFVGRSTHEVFSSIDSRTV